MDIVAKSSKDARNDIKTPLEGKVLVWFWFMVFNATFNNISVIS
jgi:hypothetical protein